MTKIILNVLIAASTLLVGCAGIQSSNPLDPTAKKFQPEAGKAGLYINRQGDMGSSATTLQIVLDGHNAGLLLADTYQWLSVDPGEHELMLNIASGEQDGLPPGGFSNASQVKFSVQPGKNYFFRANLRFGSPKTQLNLVPVGSEEGHKAISVSKLAPAPAAGMDPDTTQGR